MKTILIWVLLYLERKSGRVKPTTMIVMEEALTIVPQYELRYIWPNHEFIGAQLFGYGLWLTGYRYYRCGMPCSINGTLIHGRKLMLNEIREITVGGMT